MQINGREIDAVLDSGAYSSVLTMQDAAAIGVTPGSPGVVAGASHGGVGKGLVKSWIGPFHSFALGNESIPEVKIAFADLYAGHVVRIMGELQASLLGADFLRSHRILVSYSQCKLYFTYVGGPVFYTASPPLSPPR